MVRLSTGRIACDLAAVVIFIVPLIVIDQVVVPYRRGFYCDDETIRYPHKPQSVGGGGLIVAGLVIPICLIIIAEVFRVLVWEKDEPHQTYKLADCDWNVHRLIVRLYIFVGYFFVGVCFNQLLVGIAKNTIGRKRPHFIDVCRPDVGYEYCPGIHEYILDYKCLGPNLKLIHESKLSFYSGHASLCFYAAWYLALYLQARIYRPLVSQLILPIIQILLFGGAGYVALTRISDYEHHWSDVLAGAVMGSIIGIANAVIFADVFERREIPDSTQGSSRHSAKPTDVIVESGSNTSLD
jgi:phosphatidate phosphatase